LWMPNQNPIANLHKAIEACVLVEIEAPHR
jgi:hypothetical protein